MNRRLHTLAILALALTGMRAASAQSTGTAPRDSALPSRASTLLSGDSATARDGRACDGLGDCSNASLVTVNSFFIDRYRSAQLIEGVTPGRSLLLRSPSSLRSSRSGIRTIAPQFLVVINSAIPFSQNNGAMWAGKGTSTRTIVGLEAQYRRAWLTFAPEIVASNNADWPLRQDYWAPDVPADRAGRGYVFPYYIGPYSIDQPMRFGNKPIRWFDFGQSSVGLSTGKLEFGVANENEWWGPGIRNAIVLSNNAPGFPHLFVRSARPLGTRFGGFEFRWLVGGLVESRYFDTVSTNNVRSLASFATTLQTRWDPNLSVGFARSVYATASGWGSVAGRWLDVLANTHHPNDVPLHDSTLSPGGRDQLYSLFGRWVFPNDGAEVYAELGRTEFPRSLRDFIVAPNHSQGYTIGMQWRQPNRPRGGVRLQAEITQLEQSATFRDRAVGSWYTSRKVIQGYTNRGEILGAAIGPGASSQWMALDYLKPGWQLGVVAGRIRWNEDVHDTGGFPKYVAYCNHDVTLYPGIRAAKSGPLGALSAEWTFQNRLDAFFQNGGGCPNNGRRLDIRNNSLSVTFTPFSGR